MDKSKVTEALKALVAEDKNRSETARLGEVFDDIETALAAGISHTAVLNTLHSQGFTLTLKSFENALYRIRKKRRPYKKEIPSVNLGDSHPTPNNLASQNKQRRERLADQFMTPENTNPLLKRFKEQLK